MTGFIAAALKHRNEKPIPGLNKLALANVYLKAGMPWRSIEVLESEGDSYRPEAAAEKQMAEDLKLKYQDWETQRDAYKRDAKQRGVVAWLRAAWQRIASL